jgi:probable rRNA maturation factor
MILNQSQARIDLAVVRALVERLRRVLGLGDRSFNLCFVQDERIAELNGIFRGKSQPTDVLSFPWDGRDPSVPVAAGAEPTAEFHGFLGDVAISVETARRNAAAEGHALSRELNWLIVHGLLHLLGMDHGKDRGEMAAMEYHLRARLGLDGVALIAGDRKAGPGRRKPRTSEEKRTRRGYRRQADRPSRMERRP